MTSEQTTMEDAVPNRNILVSKFRHSAPLFITHMAVHECCSFQMDIYNAFCGRYIFRYRTDLQNASIVEHEFILNKRSRNILKKAKTDVNRLNILKYSLEIGNFFIQK